MSTTLIPPTFYVVKPRGRPVRVYATVSEAAGALVLLGSLPATVAAVIGRRGRALTHSELNELERHLGARRLSPTPTIAHHHGEREWRGDR